MSALTERIGHDHRVISMESTDTRSPDILCVCGTEGLTWSTYAAHVAEVTEAAVRAAVAAEIRAEADTFMRVTLATYGDPPVKAYLDAARIAEGKPCSD